jgi:hypothetical protein
VKLSKKKFLFERKLILIYFRGKHGFGAKRVMLFTNAATTFSDHSLKTILDSLRRQDIIVDAIGPTWGQPDEEDDENEENRANGDENSDANRPTTNGNHHQTPRKPLTQQQQTGIRVIGEIVNSTEGTLFTFRYNIKLFHKYLFITIYFFFFFL